MRKETHASFYVDFMLFSLDLNQNRRASTDISKTPQYQT
jgi:hypothetical protein